MESSSSVWPNIDSVEDFWVKIIKNAELREKIQPYYEYMLKMKQNCTSEKEIKHQIIKQTFLKVRFVHLCIYFGYGYTVTIEFSLNVLTEFTGISD